MLEIPRLLQLCFDPAYDNIALVYVESFFHSSVFVYLFCVFKKLLHQHNYVQFLCEIFVLKSTTRFHWLVEFQSIKCMEGIFFLVIFQIIISIFLKKIALYCISKKEILYRYQRKVNIGLNIIAITVKKICLDNFWHMPVWPKFILTHTYDWLCCRFAVLTLVPWEN